MPSKAIIVITFDTVVCKPSQLTFNAPKKPSPINIVMSDNVGDLNCTSEFL